MQKIPLTVVNYSEAHPLETKGGVQTFARNLRLIFDEVLYMTPRRRDIARAVRERLPVICDNHMVMHWPRDFPVIGFQHGVAHVKQQTAPTIARWFLARAQKRAAPRPKTLWIANAEWVGLEFAKLYGNGASHVIYNQVDTERFDGRLDNEGSRLLLHDARAKHKGSELMKPLQAAFPEWEIGLLDCPTSEVHNMMRRARAFIHLSKYEGNSLVCNEAMAMNLPCLFTRVGLLRDPGRPQDVFLIESEDAYGDPARLIEVFGEFVATLETRDYQPREWSLAHATAETARERWRVAMADFYQMAGWTLPTLA